MGRSGFNDPIHRSSLDLFDALAAAEGADEVRFLAFKLAAVRAAMSMLTERTTLAGLGEWIDFGSGHLRVDARVESTKRKWLMRFLAGGEELYPLERNTIATVLDRLDDSVSFYIGYAESLSEDDRAWVDKNPHRALLVRKVPVPSG